MKPFILFLTAIFFVFSISCKKNISPALVNKEACTSNEQQVVSLINPCGKTIKERFQLPKGYTRVSVEPNSFQEYLRFLPLKPHQTEVRYYNHQIKPNNYIYDAVVDLPIGDKNLHQCADAIMRLRAEYLWKMKQYDAIHFNFTNGFRVDYTKWMEGYRIQLKGNQTQWVKKTHSSNTEEDFWLYLETIFTYAGTQSLEKELQATTFQDIQIGDVLIQGGSPGHAVIVVDMAIHKTTQQKIFLLAQSYMPAQEIQILKNPMNSSFSPWYSNQVSHTFQTPEWNLLQMM